MYYVATTTVVFLALYSYTIVALGSHLVRGEWWTLIPLIVIAFWVGLYPKPFFERMAPTVDRVLQRVEVARHDQGPTAGDQVAELAHVPSAEASGEHGE